MGYCIKEKREAAGLSQEELSRMSGISRVQISNLETGATKDAKISTIKKLAVALGCSVEALFYAASV